MDDAWMRDRLQSDFAFSTLPQITVLLEDLHVSALLQIPSCQLMSQLVIVRRFFSI